MYLTKICREDMRNVKMYKCAKYIIVHINLSQVSKLLKKQQKFCHHILTENPCNHNILLTSYFRTLCLLTSSSTLICCFQLNVLHMTKKRAEQRYFHISTNLIKPYAFKLLLVHVYIYMTTKRIEEIENKDGIFI